MLFFWQIHIERYTFRLHMLYRYGNRTHSVLRRPGPLKARLMRIRWLPIMRPEHLKPVPNAKSLGILALPLPFRALYIEIYRHQPGTTVRG
jgi:hypothetical protein